MSKQKRYRIDHSMDGWPIADRRNCVVLSDRDIVNILNGYEEQQEQDINVINTAIGTAVAITNIADDDHTKVMAAHIADTLTTLTHVQDL